MKALALSLVLAMVLSQEVLGQGPQQGGVNPAQTDRVVSALRDMFSACRGLSEEYLPDCVNRGLQRGAGKISNNPSYWEAHVALTRAARSLSSLVRQYADPDARSIRVEGYRLKAVSASALPGLRSVGGEIIARTEQDLVDLSPYERDAFAPIADLIRTERPWP